MTTFFSKHKTLIYYAVAMAIVTFILQWLELRLIVFRNSFQIYAGLIAVIFTALGVWLAVKLTRVKTETIIVEKEIPAQKEFVFNQVECDKRNISKRELEVLQLMATGLSNAEIAEKLFVSANTIKTHAANIFEKLEAKRRIQAVEHGKQLGLIP